MTGASTTALRAADSFGVTDEAPEAIGISSRSAGPTQSILVGRVARIVPIQFLGRADIKLSSPVYALIDESASGDYSAICHDLELGGAGKTEFEAVDDLRAQIAELYDALTEMRKDLPEHLHLKLAFLESVVTRVLEDR